MIKKRKFISTICAAVLLLSLLPLSAFGAQEEAPEVPSYRGKVSVKGSEPHTWTALTTSDTVYKLTGSLTQEIRQEYQGHNLTIAGNIIKEALGPGFPAELEVIEIIKVE